MVNSSAISVIGLIRGMNALAYHPSPSGAPAPAGSAIRDERNSQVNQDAAGDLPDPTSHHTPSIPKSGGSTVRKIQA